MRPYQTSSVRQVVSPNNPPPPSRSEALRKAMRLPPVPTSAYIYIYIYICMCICVYVYMCICVYYICMYIYIYIYTSMRGVRPIRETSIWTLGGFDSGRFLSLRGGISQVRREVPRSLDSELPSLWILGSRIEQSGSERPFSSRRALFRAAHGPGYTAVQRCARTTSDCCIVLVIATCKWWIRLTDAYEAVFSTSILYVYGFDSNGILF